MTTSLILGQVALGYSPLIDKQHIIGGTRLTIVPLRQDLSLAPEDLCQVLHEVWPEGSKTGLLNVLHEGLLSELQGMPLPQGLMLEWPAFMAGEEKLAEAIESYRAKMHGLMLKGRSTTPLAPEMRAAFKQAVLDLDDVQNMAMPDVKLATQGLPLLVAKVRDAEGVKKAFEMGAQGVIGWPTSGPFEAPESSAKPAIQADLQVIVELMSRVDQGEDISRLEETLKRDPSLAFKLLRYLNSAAFGLPVEVSSFRHAIMLLGYPRLKRWLALLLTTASKDHAMRPIMYGALRRGLLMEELAKSMNDTELRDEMFICGLFSLLDHMLKQPFARLLPSIPVPDRVREALIDHRGPFAPYLDLVRAIEDESVFDFRSAAERLMLSAEEINRAVVNALAKAVQLE
ncbi:MAG: HDOD domain-containing protein [Burkholderiaceae bacterium]|nr:HDOD domain-containing protein [Burkholderiaceae bacterium]